MSKEETMKRIKSTAELMDWFNEQLPAIEKKFGKSYNKYLSMDRSQLVAECCRLLMTTMSAMMDLWFINQTLKGEQLEEIRKAAEEIWRNPDADKK